MFMKRVRLFTQFKPHVERADGVWWVTSYFMMAHGATIGEAWVNWQRFESERQLDVAEHLSKHVRIV